MASLKDIRNRIKSVTNTQKITKAMKMVSAAKLRRAQEAIENNRTYVDTLGEILTDIASKTDLTAHPLVAAPEAEKKVELIIVTSDKGLCGSFNANVLKASKKFIDDHQGEKEVTPIFLGRKSRDYFRRRGFPDSACELGFLADLNAEKSRALFEASFGRFQNGECDAVYVIYSRFKSAMTQFPTLERLLPLPLETGDQADSNEAIRKEQSFVEFLYEPDRDSILDELLPSYAVSLMHRMFLDSAAGEHGARMTAMDAATNNCSDLIERLTLLYNRTRQAAITKELIEIISGAEAL